MKEWMGIVLVPGALGALMLGVRALQWNGVIGAELARKLVHLGMGVVCLFLPWLFSSVWPVWLLTAAAVAVLAGIRRLPRLQEKFGGVLGGVSRSSRGEMYFPVGVALVFTLARGEPVYFCVPVAVLTFADTAGALIGQRWGRNRYEAVESTKSVEGSTAVLLVTWFCVTAGLLAFTPLPWPQAWLAGLGLGHFALLVEAVSWNGLDNLLLPLATLAQLKVTTRLGTVDLGVRALALMALAVFMLTWRRHALLDASARLGAALGAFLCWSIGGWTWLVAPGVLLVSYTQLMPTVPGGPMKHNLVAILCIGSAGLPWLLVQALVPDDRWLWFFTLGLAAQQAIIAAVRFSQGRPNWRPWQWWAVALLQAGLAQGVAFVAANGPTLISLQSMLAGLGALGATLAVFMLWDPCLSDPPDLTGRWWRQGTAAVLASLVGFVAMAT